MGNPANLGSSTQKSEASSSPARTRFSLLLWLLIPFVIYAGAEKRIRPWVMRREGAYAGVLAFPPDRHVDLVFIGVSRVEAAINSSAFDDVVSKATGKPFYSLNMGGGNRIPCVHYYGLRNLFRTYPEKFKGCTVLIEAPFGTPAWSKWQDPWLDDDHARMVMSNVSADALPGLLAREPGLPNRLHIFELYAEKHSALVFYRGLIRRRLEGKLTTKLTTTLDSLHLIEHEDARRNIDVNTSGDIRVDPGAVEVGRLAMLREIHNARTNPVTVEDWNQTIIGDIRKLVESNGGRVVLFDMPVHDSFREIYSLPSYSAMHELLERQRREWNVPIIKADFHYTNLDFPDYWHLSSNRSDEFSSRLADAWLKNGDLEQKLP